MAVAIAALLGLAFAGQQYASDTQEDPHESEKYEYNTTSRIEKEKADFNLGDVYDIQQRNIGNRSFTHKQENQNLGDVTNYGSRYPVGAPVWDVSAREFVTNKMNNLNPNPMIRVGPGMGVGPNVPAYGGKHQLFRVLPVNTNGHRLVQLPGRFLAPPVAQVFSGELPQTVQKHRPEKEYSVITGGPNMAIKTAPPTRPTDVKGGMSTRKDAAVINSELHMGNPRMRLNNGYLIAPNNKLLHTRDNRSNPDRPGNPGRLNVREGPLNAGGMATSVRIDTMKRRTEHGVALSAGYIRSGIQEANQYKENPIPYSLDLAKTQLKDNPYNHPLS